MWDHPPQEILQNAEFHDILQVPKIYPGVVVSAEKLLSDWSWNHKYKHKLFFQWYLNKIKRFCRQKKTHICQNSSAYLY